MAVVWARTEDAEPTSNFTETDPGAGRLAGLLAVLLVIVLIGARVLVLCGWRGKGWIND